MDIGLKVSTRVLAATSAIIQASQGSGSVSSLANGPLPEDPPAKQPASTRARQRRPHQLLTLGQSSVLIIIMKTTTRLITKVFPWKGDTTQKRSAPMASEVIIPNTQSGILGNSQIGQQQLLPQPISLTIDIGKEANRAGQSRRPSMKVASNPLGSIPPPTRRYGRNPQSCASAKPVAVAALRANEPC